MRRRIWWRRIWWRRIWRRRIWRRRIWWLPGLLCGLFIPVLLLGGCMPAVYTGPYPVGPVVLPRDEAAHPAPTEWWYFTGHLAGDEGTSYGFELTFFKVYPPADLRLGPLPAPLLVPVAFVGHAALTDKGNDRFVGAQRLDLWGYRAGASSERLDVFVGDWYARRNGDVFEIGLSVGGDELSLVLEPRKPAALHGRPPGIQTMGPGGVSYYLSYTRLAAAGELRRCRGLRCRVVPVTGQAWHDHQWGDFRVDRIPGWDWFALQFDDDSELMLYLIRGADGSYQAGGGSLVTADGTTVPLAPEAFVVTPLGRRWTSPTTGASYPLDWRVQVPGRAIDVEVSAVVAAQEMDTRASTGVVYWEGAVEVRGSQSGVGYVELTNYDRAPAHLPE